MTSAAVTARDLVSRRNIYVLSALLVGFLVTGTLADYAISEGLYAPENQFALVLAAYGATPSFLAVASSGTLLIAANKNDEGGVSAAIRFLFISVGSLLVVGSLGAAVIVPAGYWELPPLVLIAVGVVLIGSTVVVTWIVARGATRRQIMVVAGVLFVVVAVQGALIYVIKLIWERPRMRLISVGGGPGFEAWFNIGFPGKADLIAAGTAADDFKSFPSAHTGNAATLMLLTVFGALSEKVRPHTSALLWVGALWGFSVAFARIVAGAHFVTDTTVGFAVTFLTMLVVYQVAYPRMKEFISKEGGGPTS